MRELQRERGPGHLVRDPSYAGSPHFSSMQWLLGPASQQDRRSVYPVSVQKAGSRVEGKAPGQPFPRGGLGVGQRPRQHR